MRSAVLFTLLALTCVSLLQCVIGASAPTCMNSMARSDCGWGDENDCVNNGCCWNPVNSTSDASASASGLLRGTPWCFHKQSIVGGYALQSIQSMDSITNPGWQFTLALYDGNGYFGTDIPTLNVQVTFETVNRLRVKIYDPSNARWEIPTNVLPFAALNTSLNLNDVVYSLSYTTKPFGFAVTRVEDNEVIFNTTAPIGPDGSTPLFNGLVFSEQYLEISTQLPQQPAIYGLGEKVTSLQLATTGRKITFWARDAPDPPDQNIYGSHPFYLENRAVPVYRKNQKKQGKMSTNPASQTETKTHGVWLRNSNGLDVVIHDANSALAAFAENSNDASLPRSVEELPVDAQSAATGYLTYRAIGGVFDFFIYVGSTGSGSPTVAGNSAEFIVSQYHTSVGFPHMPPLWSLGFHQCRWGYPNLQAIETVVQKYAAAKIPLDTAWNDIDYMNAYEDFSTDPVNFPTEQVAAFIEQLHSNNQHYVMIIDPAIHNRTGYAPYDNGLQADVFVKQSNGDTFIGKVWPGYTAFPSFYASNTQQWWTENIVNFRQQVPVDGLWIDMNEASNFCSGDCDSPTTEVGEVNPRLHGLKSEPAGWTESYDRSMNAKQEKFNRLEKAAATKSHHKRHHVILQRSHKCRDEHIGRRTLNNLNLARGETFNFTSGAELDYSFDSSVEFSPNNPPYRINNGGGGNVLNTLTLDVDAVHSDSGYLEYNVHNMYGFSESIATNTALESTMSTRSLVISRSTFSGSGNHAGHWLGDNWSTFTSMTYSIGGVLAMNFFGIPLVGADICGFNGNTNEELCARWMALGAFYPFSRNHNSKGSVSQEPYLWPSVTAVSQLALGARYSLIHVYNTLFYQAHINGGTVARPVFFQWGNDVNTWDIDQQFLIGNAIMITPVLTQGATSVQGYFPPLANDGSSQNFFDFWTLAPLTVPASGVVTLNAPLSTIPVHIIGGVILPLQTPAMTITGQVNENPFNLVVAMSSAGTASGDLFLDDGLTLNIGAQNNSLVAHMSFASGSLQYTPLQNGYAPAATLIFNQIQVLGVEFSPLNVTLNNSPVKFQWFSENLVLEIQALQLPLNEAFQAQITFA